MAELRICWAVLRNANLSTVFSVDRVSPTISSSLEELQLEFATILYSHTVILFSRNFVSGLGVSGLEFHSLWTASG